MERWPVNENGIALPPDDLWLPPSRLPDRHKNKNNHHHHWTEKAFLRSMAHVALRDLARHQSMRQVDVHRWIHDNHLPPEPPTERQAAREVIDAYDKGEQFHIYDKYARQYFCHDIPRELVDGLVAKHGLIKVFDMAAD